MEKMVDMMHHAADSEGEEEKQEEDDFIKFAKLPLDKNQLKDINKAFLEDMKNFKPTGHDEKSIHSGNEWSDLMLYWKWSALSIFKTWFVVCDAGFNLINLPSIESLPNRITST